MQGTQTYMPRKARQNTEPEKQSLFLNPRISTIIDRLANWFELNGDATGLFQNRRQPDGSTKRVPVTAEVVRRSLFAWDAAVSRRDLLSDEELYRYALEYFSVQIFQDLMGGTQTKVTLFDDNVEMVERIYKAQRRLRLVPGSRSRRRKNTINGVMISTMALIRAADKARLLDDMPLLDYKQRSG